MHLKARPSADIVVQMADVRASTLRACDAAAPIVAIEHPSYFGKPRCEDQSFIGTTRNLQLPSSFEPLQKLGYQFQISAGARTHISRGVERREFRNVVPARGIDFLARMH